MNDHAPQIIAGLGRITRVLRGGQWADGGRLGLTPTQADILHHLSTRGPARISAIARALSVTQPTASDAVSALAGKGLVERGRDPADGRVARVGLTPSGRSALSQAALPQALRLAVDSLDEAAAGDLRRGLGQLIRALQTAGAIDPARLCITCSHFRPNQHMDAARPHHCALVDAAFGDAALRLDCDDHLAVVPSPFAGPSGDAAGAARD